MAFSKEEFEEKNFGQNPSHRTPDKIQNSAISPPLENLGHRKINSAKFSKTFPRTIQGSNYPLWEEIYLTEQEERAAEESCRQENFQLMDEALQEAKMLAIKHGINEDQIRTQLAIALF